MKLLRFVPVAQVGHVRHHGIKTWRYRNRASGVYCYPIIGDRKSVRHWYRVLRSTTPRGKKTARLAAVVFEVSDEELVYCFADWADNLHWGKLLNWTIVPTADGGMEMVEEEGGQASAEDELSWALIPAREAERRAFAARQNAQPLTTEEFAQLMEQQGRITAVDMPYYGLGDAEVVVPRPITADEIVSIQVSETRESHKHRRWVPEDDEL